MAPVLSGFAEKYHLRLLKVTKCRLLVYSKSSAFKCSQQIEKKIS